MKVMRLTLTMEEIANIKRVLSGDRTGLSDLSLYQRKRFIAKAKKFKVANDRLYYVEDGHYLEAIADDDIQSLERIFRELHEEWNHIGMMKLYIKARECYMGFKREQLYKRVRVCPVCQRHTPLKRSTSIKSIVAETAWQHLQADCVDLRMHSDANDGYGWILTVIDVYSKYLFAFPMRDKSAESVYLMFRRLFTSVGPPQVLQTDNGREFINAKVRELLTSMNIRHSRGRPRHPQSQGQVERVNQTITRIIGKVTFGEPVRRWVDKLDLIVLNYNQTWHRATGRTPMYMLFHRESSHFGINLNVPEDNSMPGNDASIIEQDEISSATDLTSDNVVDILAEEDLRRQREDSSDYPEHPAEIRGQPDEERRLNHNYQESYLSGMRRDADVHTRKRAFGCGDLVLIKKEYDTNQRTSRKSGDSFYEDGVWTVMARAARNTFLVALNGQEKRVHKDLLKHFNRPSE